MRLLHIRFFCSILDAWAVRVPVYIRIHGVAALAARNVSPPSISPNVGLVNIQPEYFCSDVGQRHVTLVYLHYVRTCVERFYLNWPAAVTEGVLGLVGRGSIGTTERQLCQI